MTSSRMGVGGVSQMQTAADRGGGGRGLGEMRMFAF